MTIETWLRLSIEKLRSAGLTSARLDSLILLENELGKDRSWLLAHDDSPLAKQHMSTLNKKVALRETHIPLAYIRGHSQFYGRDFLVNDHVLVPRPESESIIELLLDAVGNDERPTIIDVGTGSGALAITATLEVPRATVLGTDIDPNCLDQAVRNADVLKSEVTFIESDLLHPVDGQALPPADILLANLPYVPASFEINQAASHEPRLAIFGGDDGLTLFRSLFRQLQLDPRPKPSRIISEALPTTHKELEILANENGYQLASVAGFAQLFVAA